jgi:hypothetical protein
MSKSPRESLEAKFKIYAEEWLEADVKIEDLTLNGLEVPDEIYETKLGDVGKRQFHYYVKDQTIKLGLT